MFDYDVLIAGYGPTGAVAANLLGMQGVRVLVVEPNLEIYDLPRAVHFDGEVMRVFQAIGLVDEIENLAEPGDAIGFTNGKGWNLLQQDLTQVPRHHGWANNNFFNQPALEAELRIGVQRFANVDVRLGSNVSDFSETEDRVVVEIRGQDASPEVTVRYLLGCDGASSSVRDILGIAQEDLGCDEPWLVCDWMLPAGMRINRRAYQICDPARPTTLVPCEGGHIRWEFMVSEGESSDELEQESLVRELMSPHVNRLSDDLNANMGEIIRAKVYRFHALIAESFQSERVFLLGDAAHQMPPFLGQGMCAGIRDAHNLAWKISGVLSGRYRESVLTSYTTERRPHVQEVIKTAVGHGGIIQNRSKVLTFVRDCFLKLGGVFPSLISFLRFDLSWPLGPGLFDLRGGHELSAPIGETFPQCSDSDERLGSGFCVVVSDPDLVSGIDVCADIECKYISDLAVDEGALTELEVWFGDHDVKAVVVRPDRYVYGCSASVAGTNKLIDDLRESLLEHANEG